MKNARFKVAYRSNASKLHRAVGDLLTAKDSPFSSFKVYQEYPVSRINSSYKNKAHKFDWVILDLKIVIECHGKQHYEEVHFGGEKVFGRLSSQKARDNTKMQAALDAGFGYVEIPYYDISKLSLSYLSDKIKIASAESLDSVEEEQQKRPAFYVTEEMKEKAREYRREQYRRKKEWLKSREE